MESVINSLISTFNINPDDFVFIAGCSIIFVVTLILLIFVKDEVPPADSTEPQIDDSAASEQEVTPPVDLEETVAVPQELREDQPALEEVPLESSEDFIAKTDIPSTAKIEEPDKCSDYFRVFRVVD